MNQKKNPPSESFSSAKRIRKGGVWAILGRGGSAFFGFIISALMARLLTPEEFGAYFLVFSLVTLGSIFGQMGLDRTSVRLIASAMVIGDTARCKNIINTVLRYGAMASLIISIILYFGVGQWIVEELININNLNVSVAWVALWVVVLVLETLISNIFRGFHNIKLTVTFSGLVRGALLSLVLIYLWINSGASNLNEMIVWTVCAGLISTAIGFLLLKYKIRDYKTDNNKISKDIFSNALPMLTHAFLLYVIAQTNVWILGIYRSNDEVALYGTAMRLVLLVGISTSIVNAVVPPLIAEKYSQGNIKSIEGLLRSAATVCGTPALIVLLVYIFFGGWILSSIFGDFYTDAAMALLILSVAEIFNVLTGACSVTLNMTGHQVHMMSLTVVRAVISVIGGIIVVESYGILGVSIVYGVSLVAYNFSSLILTRKLVGIWTHVGVSKINDILHVK